MKRSLLVPVFALVLLIPLSDARAGYSSLFVFGDSLSDSGNIAVLTPNRTPVPISGNDFIPTFPYASGHYTNAQVWAQIVASSLGLSANPSLLGGTDYAFGGARTGPLTPSSRPRAVIAELLMLDTHATTVAGRSSTTSKRCVVPAGTFHSKRYRSRLRCAG